MIKINESQLKQIVAESVRRVIKEWNDRYIKTYGDLFDYFYNYLERHFDEITDNVSLKNEFDDMWPVAQDYIDFDRFNISEQEAFDLFQHAFGKLNSGY